MTPHPTDDLGLDAPITRKDFLNAALLGAGAALLHSPSPLDAMQSPCADGRHVDRPGGVGDYAASNGNTKAVMDAAHQIRDGAYAKPPKATDTGEIYELVVVGGGITGLTAAYFFAKATGGTEGPASCSRTTRSSAAKQSRTSSS